jgi:hypothetical protein
MRRLVRRLAWAGVALTVVALAFGVMVRLLEPPPGVTEANLRRIREGMTLRDVEAILGPVNEEVSWTGGTPCQGIQSWSGETGFVFVFFDEKTGKVNRTLSMLRPAPPGPLNGLRSLFGR